MRLFLNLIVAIAILFPVPCLAQADDFDFGAAEAEFDEEFEAVTTPASVEERRARAKAEMNARRKASQQELLKRRTEAQRQLEERREESLGEVDKVRQWSQGEVESVRQKYGSKTKSLEAFSHKMPPNQYLLKVEPGIAGGVVTVPRQNGDGAFLRIAPGQKVDDAIILTWPEGLSHKLDKIEIQVNGDRMTITMEGRVATKETTGAFTKTRLSTDSYSATVPAVPQTFVITFTESGFTVNQ